MFTCTLLAPALAFAFLSASRVDLFSQPWSCDHCDRTGNLRHRTTACALDVAIGVHDEHAMQSPDCHAKHGDHGLRLGERSLEE